MKKPRVVITILLFLVPPVLYIVFRIWIEINWTWLEPLIALFTYWTSVLFFLYMSDIRFHFFMKRILLALKYDHTTWLISARYSINADERDNPLSDLVEYMIKIGCRMEKRENDSLKVLWKNKHLLYFRLSFGPDGSQLHFFTTGIDVPFHQNKSIIAQLSSILETIENLIHISRPDSKKYEIDIGYAGKSPYYSYWVKKLPEEMIYDFNCSIKLPSEPDGRLLVNKNHVIIRTGQLHKLFELTQDYITLKAAS